MPSLKSDFEITVVIATRNREKSLQRTLHSVSQQTFLPREIIIVDASDSKPEINTPDSKVSIHWIFSNPSVCVQRNLGIAHATADWVFICDDDVELEPNYLFELVSHCHNHDYCGAATGIWMQKESGHWVNDYPVTKPFQLIWRFIFQLSVWGKIQVNPAGITKPIINLIVKFYETRGNKETLAGWPLVTNWREPFFETKFYSLGATLVKKEWLTNSPFDERLDAHGIGDHYGVAMKFPKPIQVLTTTRVLHHQAEENRMSKTTARTKRILALNYFQKINGASLLTRVFFYWSLTGYLIFSLLRDRKNLASSFNVFIDCFTGKPPGK